MTVAKARVIFATHMQAARKRKLTQYESNQLSTARQVLRSARKPNAPRKGYNYTPAQVRLYQLGFDEGYLGREMSDRSREYKQGYIQGVYYREKRTTRGKSQRNPKRVLIYGNVETIYAKKTQSHICDDDCKAHGHKYYHKFSSKPKMYGLPNGDLLITTR